MSPSDARILIFALALLAIGLQPGVLKAIAEELRNFRGGPPSPPHPLPGLDGPIRLRLPRQDR
jgi:hypothetical protein